MTFFSFFYGNNLFLWTVFFFTVVLGSEQNREHKEDPHTPVPSQTYSLSH